jgi:glycine/D-amino acid oxidase-like deaminating enzyme
VLPSSADIAVLGAGLAGACTALELADQGHDVLLIERDPAAMNRASLRNEGKIHLGLIYANDRTLATAFLQLQGALRFRTLMRRWLGEAFDQVALSTPFRYLVTPESLLTPAELTKHFKALEERYRVELSRSPELDYLGTRPEHLSSQIRDADQRYFDSDKFAAEFDTPELALDTADLANHVRARINAHTRIDFRSSHCVSKVEDQGSAIQVAGSSASGRWSVRARHVVNATWESRLQFDRQFGLDVQAGWLHRLKYRIIARLPEQLHGAPSATMVIGRYGDVVVRPDGTAYLSWYPAGMQGWTHDLAPPASWDGPCRGDVDHSTRVRLFDAFSTSIDEWFPGIGECEPILIDAGAIVAYGATDVDDKNSGLHGRARIGVTSVGRYHSLDPGKLTTAPYFAKIAADRVLESIRLDRLKRHPSAPAAQPSW